MEDTGKKKQNLRVRDNLMFLNRISMLLRI